MISAASRNAAFALSLAGSVLLCTGPAAFAAVNVTNGDFETGTIGDTSLTGWTVVNDRIDLGVDSLAGCLTVDDSTYEFVDDYSTGTDMPARNDSFLDDADLEEPATYETAIYDGASLADPYTVTGQVLRLASDMNADGVYGYVVHGPAVFSDEFTAKSIDDLTLRWAATGEEDDYHVFGYLLNTDSCQQIEVIDSTGTSSAWADVQVAVPENGSYRFVFVAGTYDLTWGSAAGAVLLLDDIVLTVNEERAEEEGGSSGNSGELAATGFDATTAGIAGVAMATLGAGVALVARRRS